MAAFAAHPRRVPRVDFDEFGSVQGAFALGRFFRPPPARVLNRPLLAAAFVPGAPIVPLADFTISLTTMAPYVRASHADTLRAWSFRRFVRFSNNRVGRSFLLGLTFNAAQTPISDQTLHLVVHDRPGTSPCSRDLTKS